MESIDNLRKEYESLFGRPSERVFSACGRSELIGNHTDHQHGLVLACGVTLSALALAVVLLAFLSVIWQSIRTARANPATVLKKE